MEIFCLLPFVKVHHTIFVHFFFLVDEVSSFNLVSSLCSILAALEGTGDFSGSLLILLVNDIIVLFLETSILLSAFPVFISLDTSFTDFTTLFSVKDTEIPLCLLLRLVPLHVRGLATLSKISTSSSFPLSIRRSLEIHLWKGKKILTVTVINYFEIISSNN